MNVEAGWQWSSDSNLVKTVCYQHVQNDDEVRLTTNQLHLSTIVPARRFSPFGHIVRMPNETDAKKILTASSLENWRRPPGRPHTTWMKTIQQDLKSNNLSLNEAIDVAQNRPLWRLMSTFGATQSYWCTGFRRLQWDTQYHLSHIMMMLTVSAAFTWLHCTDQTTGWLIDWARFNIDTVYAISVNQEQYTHYQATLWCLL